MALNKDSIQSQIDEVKAQMHRLEIGLQIDMVYMPDDGVSLYCCEKAILQLKNIQAEIIANRPGSGTTNNIKIEENSARADKFISDNEDK